MGKAKTRPKPLPVKIFCGLIGSEAAVAEAERLLEREFGRVDLRSEILPFDFTDYYADEMGGNLKRIWIAFEDLRERAFLPLAKHAGVMVEAGLSEGGRRKVNIDPGYVDDAQVVLSTAKNFSHRIYIGMGYYAEATMVHSGGAFRPLDWTYPDYKSKQGLKFFEAARAAYHRQLRNRDAG